MRSNLLLNASLVSTLVLSSFAFNTYADSAQGPQKVSLEYKGFFDRLKLVNKGSYPLIEIAFSVPNKEKCEVIGGNISTEKAEYPLTYTQTQRLYLPYDAELKRDRALVNLDILGDKKHCAIAMQVRARQVFKSYKPETLRQMNSEMDDLLDAMQGFPMKYFRNDIAGINFDFGDQKSVEINIDGRSDVFDGQYHLSIEKLEQLKSLSFAVEPNVVSPWIL